jgi:hypothetical protein
MLAPEQLGALAGHDQALALGPQLRLERDADRALRQDARVRPNPTQCGSARARSRP